MNGKLDTKVFTWVTTGLVFFIIGILSIYWTLFIKLNTKHEALKLDHNTTQTTLNNHLNFKCEDANEH